MITIEGEVYKKLKETAVKEGVTPFAWLLTVFQLLIHKYTASEESIIGIPASVRNDMAYSGIVGYFVNPLPTRSSIAGKKNFRECRKSCALSVAKALQHKDYPFAKIVELSGAERLTGRHPLFQVAFNYLNHTELFDEATQHFLYSAGLSVSEYVIPTQESVFDITFELKDNYESIAGTCKFQTELYNTSFIELFCRRYTFYLEQSVQNPALNLDSFQWVFPEERKLLEKWNDTTYQHKKSLSINELFSATALSHAENIAVVSPGAKITYKELDEYSNQLAHFLTGKIKNTKGKVIALITKPDSKMIIGILGILKAGAAYLPVDPDFPETRIHLMLKEANCELALCEDESLINALRLPDNASFINIKTQWQQIACCSTYALDISLQPDDPAYIMFTSGSTGRPKGVMGLHKGVTNLVKNTNYVNISPSDNFMLISNYVFDGSIFEIFGALLNGATLHILEAETIFSSTHLFSYIRSHHINTAFLSTAFFNNLVDADPSFVSFFDTIIFGGELVSIQHVKKALPYCKKEGVLNHAYGPTECSTFSLCYPVLHLKDACTFIPVGKPITNVKVYVLDEQLQPLPPGGAGELYISGMGVTGGYINSTDLTTKKFIPAPWSAEEVLYASGDFACWLPDGNIHFVGRRDHQVKVRGYRIELGEIETAISRHPAVQSAVALCTRSTEEKNIITAFVATDKSTLDVQELSDFMSRSVPHYMIPHQVHFLPAFPLNESGKIDRKKLHQIIQSNDECGAKSVVFPITDIQRRLAAIWKDVLEKESIGIQDNFFELGGHSLLAAKIISKVKSEIGVEIPLSSLFMKPTIETMSKIIEEQQQVPTTKCEPDLVKISRENFARKIRNE